MNDTIPPTEDKFTPQKWQNATDSFIQYLKFQESEFLRKYEDAKLEKERIQKIRMDLEDHLCRQKLIK